MPRHLLVSLLWFALFAQWITVVPIIVPDQVASMLGADTAGKERITGAILGAGALVALVIAPLAGALSDRSRNPNGRRRGWIAWGISGSCAGLLLLLPFNAGASLWWYAATFMFLQFWWNSTSGAYAGLIPDVVPEAEQGQASAWLNIMTVGGTVTGNVIVAIAYRPGHPAAAVLAFVALNVTALAILRRYVSEPPPGPVPAFELRAFVRSFYVDPKAHPNFYWVLVTRLLSNMGVWSIFTFLLFFFQDVVGLKDPAFVLAVLLGLGAALAIPASMIGIRQAERHGLVSVTRVTSWIMGGCAIAYTLIAFHPGMVAIVAVTLVYAASYGAYQAVDWALALRVLPSRGAAGKDMGIWHISMVLPQVLGPAGTGWLISSIKQSAGGPAAYRVAFVIGATWLLLAAALVGRVRLPSPPHPS